MASESLWSEGELRACVEAYMGMLRKEQTGTPYTKSHVLAELHAGVLEARSPKAIEWRMQNISSVLNKMGLDWINGYKPAAHVGGNEQLISRLIRESMGQVFAQPTPPAPLQGDLLFGALVPSSDALMGVKAVWGSISSYVLCFGARGGRGATDANYYALPAAAARKAVQQPFVIAIGGGANVPPGLEGRVLNLVRVSTVYGKTELFVGDQEAERLAQWPVSLAILDVWTVEGQPHLVTDLGFDDRTILAGAQDGITRRENAVEALWEVLRAWPIRPVALPALSNFYDPGRPTLVHSLLPKPPGGEKGEEGKRIWKLQQELERDLRLKKEAKRLNIERHGRQTCEACLFGHDDSAMFDVHHPTPLFAGVRTTLAEHLEVLCPTCHRRAHRKSRLVPFTLDELRIWNAKGRP